MLLNVFIRNILMERNEIYVYISKKNKQLLAGRLLASCTGFLPFKSYVLNAYSDE